MKDTSGAIVRGAAVNATDIATNTVSSTVSDANGYYTIPYLAPGTYNVTAEANSEGTGKVKFFEGTPIPTSFALVCVLMWSAYAGAIEEELWFGAVRIGGFTLHPLALMFALSGSLMISRIRIPKL